MYKRFMFMATLCFSLSLVSLVGCGNSTGEKTQDSTQTGDNDGSNKAQGESQNAQQACESYVDHIRTVYKDCTGSDMPATAKVDCSVYQSGQCNVTTYFDCLRDSYQCKEVGGTKMVMPDAQKISSCAAPKCG